jgi:hypothetical protein
MAVVKLLGYTIIKSQAEREIQNLFEQYEKTLLAPKQKICDDIIEWGDTLIQSISTKKLSRTSVFRASTISE